MTTSRQAALIPYGLADVESGVLYVEGVDGYLECLNTSSGELLARTEFAAKALAVWEGHVAGWRGVGQPNGLEVFAAQRQGRILSPVWGRTLELPDWVETGSAEPNRFTLEAEVRGRVVAVTWEAHARYEGGAPPPPRVEERETHDERRTIRLDQKNGAILGEDGSESAPRLEQNLPELPPTRRIEPYRQGTSWVTGSWRVSSVEAFLAKSVKEPGILLILREPVRGSGSREIQLSGAAAATAAVTPDGRLVFVHEPGTDELSWHVFSAETGARVNRLPFDAGTEAVAVVNGRVLYVVVEDIGTKHRRSLRCRDLHTAEAKWSHLLSEEVRKAPPPLRP